MKVPENFKNCSLMLQSINYFIGCPRTCETNQGDIVYYFVDFEEEPRLQLNRPTKLEMRGVRV